MKKLLLIVMVAGVALFGPALRADNYPSKPITLVAVFGPGSASDTICRVIAQPLSVALKETVSRAQGNRHCRESSGCERSAGRSLRRALGAGRLHAADGDQLPTFSRSVPDEERKLRSSEGLHAGDAGWKLHADAGGKSERAC